MRMMIERTGGFAGMTTKKSVDTATLPANKASQLRQLLEAANFFRLPANIASDNSQPDRFQYQLTVEDADKQHKVNVSEQAIPGTLRPLIEWIMAAGRN